ncbi:uncharacterized protein LACBIDRAFT_303559 [Laccaria bicolor S238N-H82]|uniref:Predicted protein n=1 Tax=Laccaria bicolor (strain S238N-H82 / ATCC MYA-4686) TaxID=486041 RepID=B0DJQ4_LACBS|nr:uncharacterized protein LACBIDRAFT_303559 [Laccaria bicolor S238N-H82]EDR05249.1 predicted protein [Laccaria bicolor S238N-H82]|eukprot:XP_001884214.1 predicted protein [Laccaria bicolor S238N-H82]
MSSATTAPPSSVNFPGSEAGIRPIQSPHRSTYLPFRRISLPSAPSLVHRQSVVSVASFDSLPEDEASPSLMRNVNGSRGLSGRPTSVESPRRRVRRRDSSVKPVDNSRSAKRQKVVEEFHATEKAYVDGLELIYSHFLTPIIASLDTPEPLLNRSALTSIFSNFIDIWNLHRSFLSALTTLLSDSTASNSFQDTPPLSPILLSHFPYLSLYTPFVTAFPSTISALNELITPPTTTHPNPHYNQTFATFLQSQEADPRCGKLKLRDWLLSIVQRCPRYLLLLKDLINCTDRDDPEHGRLVIVHSLVSKITLSLNTSLHTHAQTLALLALQRATPNLPFQLITPGRTLLKRGPLLQMERSESPKEREFLLFSDCIVWLAPADASDTSWDWSKTSAPAMARTRSKSEAELPTFNPSSADVSSSKPVTPSKPQRKSFQPPLHSPIKRNTSAEERWVYKGRAELVDLEVIISPDELGRLDLLGPEGSFVLYAGTDEERDDWGSEIRQAKAQLLVSLNITNPNSTLTSSTSTNHVRRSLQALPFPLTDDRLGTVRASGDSSQKGKKAKDNKKERRGRVEHWVPAIWIPDGKTEGCMRCGKMFGWRRRRHHCRLCGRCVCAACSGRTFFISDSNSKNELSKPARACDACYDTVFPLLDPPSPEKRSSNLPENSTDTITSLSSLPSWVSMPALPVDKQPQALMALDLTPSRDASFDGDATADDREKKGRLRLRPHQRLRSYHQILEDFEEQARLQGEKGEEEDNEEGNHEEEGEEAWFTPTPSLASSPASSPRKARREDTARRSKRFSLPAIALQNTSVTARTTIDAGDAGDTSVTASPTKEAAGTPGRSRRFSLMLSGRRESGSGLGQGQGEFESLSDFRLSKGVAANKLSELLSRNSRVKA